MKMSTFGRIGGFLKGLGIGSSRSLTENDLNRFFPVTAPGTVTLGRPSDLKAKLGELVLFVSTTDGTVVLQPGAGVTFEGYSGSIPLVKGVPIMMMALSTTSWTPVGVVAASAAELLAGLDLKTFVNSKTHKDYHATGEANLVIAYNHSQAAHAPANAQKNSDILKSEIEAKLTGDIASHTHPSLVYSLTKAAVEAVLTGTITTHNHEGIEYVLTKAAVEAVLTGVISSHTHAGNLELSPGDYVYKSNDTVIVNGGGVNTAELPDWMQGDFVGDDTISFMMLHGGIVRMSCQGKEATSDIGAIRFYKNKVQIGNYSVTTNFITFTKDVDVVPGDVLSFGASGGDPTTMQLCRILVNKPS